MIDGTRANITPSSRASEQIPFTRTAALLLLLAALLAGGLTGGTVGYLVGRLQDRAIVVPSAAAGGNSATADAVRDAGAFTVGIMKHGSPTVLGTGLVLDRNGYILTTSAVAAGDRFDVVLGNGRKAIATLENRDTEATGLAVLKVSAQVQTPRRSARAPRLRPGDTLISLGTGGSDVARTVGVGSVGSLGYTASVGGREPVDNLIRTDALAPEGAIGGPVLNATGEVVGLLVVPATQPGGWSLVLPIETARGVATSIIRGGATSQASLGINAIRITPEIAEERGLDVQSGALVNVVYPGSPATRKLRRGDIITAFNGKDLDERRTLESQLATRHPGETVALQVVTAGGATRRVSVRLVQKSAPPTTPAPTEDAGP